jgi:hypothetical protein
LDELKPRLNKVNAFGTNKGKQEEKTSLLSAEENIERSVEENIER